MIQKFKNRLLVLSMALVALAPLTVTGVAMAGSDISGSVCYGAENLQVNSTTQTGCTVTGGTGSDFNTLLTKIINVISVIVGVIAVIMIIFGGFRYITSGGDTTRVASAKNTILYGLIGLIIVALAQVIVRFVLKQVTSPSDTIT